MVTGPTQHGVTHYTHTCQRSLACDSRLHDPWHPTASGLLADAAESSLRILDAGPERLLHSLPISPAAGPKLVTVRLVTVRDGGGVVWAGGDINGVPAPPRRRYEINGNADASPIKITWRAW